MKTFVEIMLISDQRRFKEKTLQNLFERGERYMNYGLDNFNKDTGYKTQ